MTAYRAARASSSWAVLTAAFAVAAAAFALSCGDDQRPALVTGVDPSTPAVGNSCALAAQGCACSTPGASIACAETESVDGDEVVCIEGRRTCTDGRWGACSNELRTKKYAPVSAGSRLQALADAGAPCGNPCDPSCSNFVDTPVGVDAGSGFTLDDGGLTLPSTTAGGGGCSDIVVTPSSATLTVTRLEPSVVTDPPRVDFTATCGAGGPQIFPTWTLKPGDADTARVDPDGTLTVQAGVAKTIQVTATSAGGARTVPVVVRVAVNTVDAACDDAAAVFDAVASAGDDPGHTLYPYAVPARPVVFPLGLSAPLVQWATGGTPADCVKISLRYPAGSATPSFLWSAIVAGSADSDPTQGTVDRTQPAATIDQTAWNSFDRSAKGDEGEILVQRRPAATPTLAHLPMSIPVRFANDALRGTVYYTRYTRRLRDDANSSTNVCSRSGQNDIDIGSPAFVTSAENGCLGGNCAGAGPICPVGTCTQVNELGASLVQALDLSRPGAAPVDPFASSGGATKCPVCHSVSADGSTFVADTFAGAGVPSVASIGTAANGAAEFTPIADAPAYSWVSNRDEARGAPQREQSWGFGYAAITPDGRYALAGPNFWGNTNYNVTLGNNNQQDAGYDAGGKRYFLLDVGALRPNVDFSSIEALQPHSATATTLRATANGSLILDGWFPQVGHLVLIKNEPIASQNGVYRVIDPGSVGSRWRIVRTADADEAGELAFGQKILVKGGVSNEGKYFHVAEPTTGTIVPGTTPLGFALYTTVMAATSGPLPPYGHAPNDRGVMVLSGSGAFPRALLDDMTIADRMTVLVWNETGANAAYNGIYMLSAGADWTLTRQPEADDTHELQGHVRVRVNQGTVNGGHTFVLTQATTMDLDTSPLTFERDAALDEGVKLDQAGVASTLPTMMYPVFSPDGRSLAYVNGDRDAIGADVTGWRRGLSLLSFDVTNPTTPFGNKRRVLNTYSAASPGMVMKWPFFEPDSRGLVFVESARDEFCPIEAYGGVCSGADCGARAASVNIDTDVERACFQSSGAMGHGNGAPTHRGYWPGRLNSVNTQTFAKAELAWLNDGLESQSAALTADSGKAYQPTVLPFTAGGYRWVIFTSTRAYGNQMNPMGSHFSCGASLLWVAALDDAEAGAADRSHPAFLLPGQQIRSITDSTSSRHYINERGYLVPSPCKAVSSVCTVNEECCGAGGTKPTTECRLDPDADPPHRTCELVGACVRSGDSCTSSAQCCGNVPCVQGVCAPAAVHSENTFTRTYFASCPSGFAVRWGNFEWHAEAASTSRIAFAAQASKTDDFSAAELVPFAEANSTNVNRPGSPAHSENVNDALTAAGVASAAYLRVSMGFFPSTPDQSVAPVLYDWNQRYDCVASE